MYIFKNEQELKEEQKPDSVNRFYYGNWKDNKKNGIGALVFLKQFKNETVYEGFEGTFFNDTYDCGVYYEESIDKSYCAYYGLFDDFKKHDKEGIFFVYFEEEASVIIGDIDKDVFKEGVKFNFDDKGAFTNFIVFTMNEQQTEHEHKDQGESESTMSEEIKAKFAKVKTFFEIVNSERKSFVDTYRSLASKEEGLCSIKSFEEFYKQYDDMHKELSEERQSNFSKRLLHEIKKEGKSGN